MKVSLSLGDLTDLRKKFQESYDCEGCIQQKKFYEAGCKYKSSIMCRHCVEYDINVHAPYCSNCKEKLPLILACNDMIKHCKREREEFYNLDKSTHAFKMLKDHLPETDAEVDSFFYSIIPKDRNHRS